ncbi:hypothetical protein CMO93_04820 [Candidatus Woesearchaeota archaeon]|nr:hypothetical protein [Candidatus Woesearchaeota archaeon]|tara:strand:- start:863 stop:1999 length:1137 start_codon:yes stop_codon:yes gene_type:complete
MNKEVITMSDLGTQIIEFFIGTSQELRKRVDANIAYVAYLAEWGALAVSVKHAMGGVVEPISTTLAVDAIARMCRSIYASRGGGGREGVPDKMPEAGIIGTYRELRSNSSHSLNAMSSTSASRRAFMGLAGEYILVAMGATLALRAIPYSGLLGEPSNSASIDDLARIKGHDEFSDFSGTSEIKDLGALRSYLVDEGTSKILESGIMRYISRGIRVGSRTIKLEWYTDGELIMHVYEPTNVDYTVERVSKNPRFSKLPFPFNEVYSDPGMEGNILVGDNNYVAINMVRAGELEQRVFHSDGSSTVIRFDTSFNGVGAIQVNTTLGTEPVTTLLGYYKDANPEKFITDIAPLALGRANMKYRGLLDGAIGELRKQGKLR